VNVTVLGRHAECLLQRAVALRYRIFKSYKLLLFLHISHQHVVYETRNMFHGTSYLFTPMLHLTFLPARLYASAGNSDRNVSVSLSVRPSVCLSRAGIVSKRRKLEA